MKTIVRRTENSSLEYECGHNYQKLRRCVPDDGILLFEVKATYSPTHPPATYYRLGKSVGDVKRQFTESMCWLKVVLVRHIPPGEEAEAILTDPMRMPI